MPKSKESPMIDFYWNPRLNRIYVGWKVLTLFNMLEVGSLCTMANEHYINLHYECGPHQCLKWLHYMSGKISYQYPIMLSLHQLQMVD